MTRDRITYRNGQVFDGTSLHKGWAVQLSDGVLSAMGPVSEIPDTGKVVDLTGDIIGPGYVDLQVNGGGGVLFNDAPSVETLEKISQAHHRLGVRAFLPTLITADAASTQAAVAAAAEAVGAGVRGVAGLHLEGPHLAVTRKGAHNSALIRPMEPPDLEMMLAAADVLPALMVTLAPESATEEQVATLSNAGVLVSLGHTNASFETCQRYFSAGARCATHIFNAMSQLGSREPGLVGAALSCGEAAAGLIADAIHVHPETMRVAWRAKRGPAGIFLVSDAMAVAGTDLPEFELGGRRVVRQAGKLTLEDGTLAGADTDLTNAVRITTEEAGLPLEVALQAATSVPSKLIGLPSLNLRVGQTRQADMIRISRSLDAVRDLCDVVWPRL